MIQRRLGDDRLLARIVERRVAGLRTGNGRHAEILRRQLRDVFDVGSEKLRSHAVIRREVVLLIIEPRDDRGGVAELVADRRREHDALVLAVGNVLVLVQIRADQAIGERARSIERPVQIDVRAVVPVAARFQRHLAAEGGLGHLGDRIERAGDRVLAVERRGGALDDLEALERREIQLHIGRHAKAVHLDGVHALHLEAAEVVARNRIARVRGAARGVDLVEVLEFLHACEIEQVLRDDLHGLRRIAHGERHLVGAHHLVITESHGADGDFLQHFIAAVHRRRAGRSGCRLSLRPRRVTAVRKAGGEESTRSSPFLREALRQADRALRIEWIRRGLGGRRQRRRDQHRPRDVSAERERCAFEKPYDRLAGNELAAHAGRLQAVHLFGPVYQIRARFLRQPAQRGGEIAGGNVQRKAGRSRIGRFGARGRCGLRLRGQARPAEHEAHEGGDQ